MSEDAIEQLTHSSHVYHGNKYPLVVLLDNFEVPMNVGSIFRIADALGIQKIYLTGSSLIPPNKNIKKTSRSTEKYVDFEYQSNSLELIETLKQKGFTIVSLEITSSSKDVSQVDFSQHDKVCLILGSENRGVDQSLLGASDFHIHIPMLGRNSSMNVAVACGIAIYEVEKSLIMSKATQ